MLTNIFVTKKNNKREKRKKHSNIKKLKYNILLTIKSHYYNKSRNYDSMVINIYIYKRKTRKVEI